MNKLLVVDDEAYTRNYMKSHIPKLHSEWEVGFEASDGREALDVLAKHHVDLVITDIKMPEMDGLELAKQISEKYPHQHVIILSGYDDFSFAKEAIHYGVESYLLKPIVKEELKEALDQIATQIEEDKTKQMAFRTMKHFSETSKAHIVKNFLKAVTSESNVEIKSLYPLIYRFKINLIEGEAMVMILSLDQDVMLRQPIHYRDHSIYQFILNEIATEMIEQAEKGWVFLDQEQQTVVYLTGETESKLTESSKQLFNQINRIMMKDTGLTITGAAGNAEHEILQIGNSYRNAKQLLLHRLISGGDAFYSFSQHQRLPILLKDLEKSVSAIQSGLLNGNSIVFVNALKEYAGLFDWRSAEHFYRFGAFLIDNLAKMSEFEQAEQMEQAYMKLKKTGAAGAVSLDDAIQKCSEIVNLFSNDADDENDRLNEHDAVIKAKEYIYAHYSEPLSLALIAEKIGVSVNYLSSIFHKRVGESYIKFLTRVRMEQAAQFLTMKNPLKIYEISERVGYLSVKHFSHVFKQYYQKTPGEFQSEHKAVIHGDGGF